MIAWAVEMLLASSLLMALVLVLREPVGRLFGAQAAYALWLAPALRMLLPPLPATPAVLPAEMASGAPDYLLAVAPAAGRSLLPIDLLLGSVWIAGALAYLALHCWRHHRFIVDALAHGQPLHIEGVAYDVVASTRVEGPMAAGLVHPLIFVPDDFEQRFTPEQQRFALTHEQLHHRRGDIWASAAALIAAALHWFNPLAHVAVRAFRRDMEAACDSSVLDQAGRSAAPDYAQTILRSAVRPVPRSLCALTSIDELKGRLMMLKNHPGQFRRAAGLLLASALTVGGLATASVAQESGGTREFVKKVEIRHLGEKDALTGAGRGELRQLARECSGEKFEASVAGGSEQRKENVKFVLCAKDGQSLLSALEKAAADIEQRDEMPAEQKAEVLAKIRAKMAELRASS